LTDSELHGPLRKESAMALVTYISPSRAATLPRQTPRRRRLKGPAHAVLRSAIKNAVAGTERDWRITQNVVGDDIIDHLDELDDRRLRVLATVYSMLLHDGGRRR